MNETSDEPEQEERDLLAGLRRFRHSLMLQASSGLALAEHSTGGRNIVSVAGRAVRLATFMIVQGVIAFVWIVMNIVGVMKGWDRSAFILLNVVLFLQTAYAALNVKAELELVLLHGKIEQLREQGVKLAEAVGSLSEILGRRPDLAPPSGCDKRQLACNACLPPNSQSRACDCADHLQPR